MPILLYLPKNKGGPYSDSTLTVSGVTKVVLGDKVNEPYLPTTWDGRLIFCTHGARQKPVVLTEDSRWLTATEFVQKYKAHFQYLKAQVKRIDLFICHTGYSGFAEAFAEQMRLLLDVEHVVINAPTAQFTIQENAKNWRVGVGVGQAVPYMIGLYRLFLLGKFDRYGSPFSTMAWGGYPKPRPGFSLKRVWTALSGNAASRPAHHTCQWFGFGFKQFSIFPTARSQKPPPALAIDLLNPGADVLPKLTPLG